MLARLAFDEERSLFIIPLIDARRSDLLETTERESPLMLDPDVDREESGSFDVKPCSGADLSFREMERRIQDGDNRSMAEGEFADMTRSDMEEPGLSGDLSLLSWLTLRPTFGRRLVEVRWEEPRDLEKTASPFCLQTPLKDCRRCQLRLFKMSRLC